VPEISWSQTRPNASNVIQRLSATGFGQRRIFALTGPVSIFSCHATRRSDGLLDFGGEPGSR
jgi:hypothetical protein